MPYIRKQIKDLEGYQLASHPQAIKLNQNEVAYDLPAALKAKVLEKILHISWNRYPFSQPTTLRNSLSQFLKWPEEGILLSNGSNVLIQAMMIATSMNQKVLTIAPTFSLYEIEGKVLGNEVESVALGENFSFPLEEFLKRLSSPQKPPSIIFIANPNAPTGNLFPKEALLKVIQNAPCLVVVDEAYCQFADYNLLEELPHHPNLVLLRTFSKAFGLGGVRLGFALGHPEIIREIGKILLPYCVSGINEAIAELMLEHPEIIESYVSEIKLGRVRLYQSMTHISGVKAYPSQTNFLIFQVDDAPRVFEGLLTEGVLVRNVSHPPLLPHTLRVTVGTEEENEKFIRALEKVMKSISGGGGWG